MDTLEAIHTRRSIRRYEDKEVSKELIQKILKAGMQAPSAGNAQTWQFIIIEQKEILEKIPQIHEYAQMASQAQVGILVCGDLNKEIHEGFWVQDCSAAIQNILLATHELGLGAVWTGIYPVEEKVKNFRKMFQLPENIIPLAFIPIGYPAEEKKEADRFDEEKIHYNKW